MAKYSQNLIIHSLSVIFSYHDNLQKKAQE